MRINRAAWLGILLSGMVTSRALATVNFTVNFSDPNQTYSAYYSEIQSNLLAAGANWSRYLIGDTTISLDVEFTNDPGATGRSWTTQYVQTDTGVDVYAQGAGYKVATGSDPGAPYDAIITIGTDYLENNLWFDPDPIARTATIPANRTDAVSVFIHELAHVFAFNGWRDSDTWDLPGDYESTFDELVTTQSGNAYFVGAAAKKVYGGPVPITYGDYAHFGNEPPLPGSDLIQHELMNGVVFNYSQRYYISPLDLAVFQDVGVPVNATLLLGDTNDDGKIDGTDLEMLTANIGKHVTTGYAAGDLDGNGIVNSDDFALFSLGLSSYNAAAPTWVPEPAQSFIGIAALCFTWKRRRR
ncbi:MAG TPA: dockerin type I repeat-containing protein [Tepidisphaeraceae bacterium]|jgi:hypothetical protein